MYYERSGESQRLQRFDLELDAIFKSVFINRAMWNLITHAHLCPQNKEDVTEKENVWNHSRVIKFVGKLNTFLQ